MTFKNLKYKEIDLTSHKNIHNIAHFLKIL